MDETTRELTDEDIRTVMPGETVKAERDPSDMPGDTDGKDAGDGTDGDATDGRDGDARDTDGSDGKDADGTDTGDMDGTDAGS